MKTKYKTTLSLFMILFVLKVSAQSKIQYSHDRNGNRVQRKLIVTGNSTGRIEAPTDSTQAIVIPQHVIGVFPNPTQDMLNVNISRVETDETVDLFLSDESGRTLVSLKNQAAISTVNMANYRTGAYYLQVKVGKDKPKVYKVMKIE